MPILRVDVWPDHDQATKKAFAEALTEATVKHIGCPREAVTILMNEVPKTEWYMGGRPHSELFPPR